MELSVREVAVLVGRSARAVRAQVARGELPGVKRGGEWRIPRHGLPLTEAQRRVLYARADEVRQAVDAALPSRVATRANQRDRSLADLEGFRLGATLLADIRGAGVDAIAAATRDRLAEAIEGGLIALAEATLLYEREVKLAALNQARAAFARAIAMLPIEQRWPLRDPQLGWLTTLEAEIVPAIAGLARWTERLPRQRR